MVYARDFPRSFRVQCNVANKRLERRFRVWSFGRIRFCGNRRNILLISALFAKSVAAACRP